MRKLIAGLAICALAWGVGTAGQSLPPEQLDAAIREKAKELEEIQKQLFETQKSLNQTKVKGQSLNQELGKIKSNLKQLDLGIKTNTVKIGKLSLEIDVLENDIDKAEETVRRKSGAVASIMKEVQEKDGEDPLIIFMKNGTLSDALEEQSHLAELNTDLGEAIDELEKANAERKGKLEDRATKKKGVEGEYKSLKAKKTIVEDVKKERQEILAETKSQEQEYKKIVADLAKRQAEIASEIEAMDAQLRLKINPSGIPGARKGILGWPTPSPLMTQEYGATDFALSGGYKGKWHNGLDFGGAFGSPILAAESGTVIAAGDQDIYCRRGAYGKFAIIQHPNNLVTLYGHMSQVAVQVGQKVVRGETIGYMGKTGYAFGTHLHFTVYDAATFSMRGSKTCGPMPSGGDIDPRKYL